MNRFILTASLIVASLGISPSSAANGEYQNVIPHDPSKCSAGSAVKVVISGINSSVGKLRVQSYRGVKQDWLQKSRWLSRIEVPARAGNITICMPVSGPGVYAIAVRHDKNGNGKTDLTEDGGGMSNNPSINIFNLGKPSYTKTRFNVGSSPVTITITMKYM